MSNQKISSVTNLAIKYYDRFVDLNGEPILFHAIRVASNFPIGSPSWVVAMLHDLLEDTACSFAEVADICSSEEIGAIQVLTRDDDETYEAYINRVKENTLAQFVKICDLEDNMDLKRFKKRLTAGDLNRIEKYQRAYIHLKY